MIFFHGYTLTIEEAHEEIQRLQTQLLSYEEEIKRAEQQYGKDSHLYEVEKDFIDKSIQEIKHQIFIYQALIRTLRLIQNFVSTPPPKQNTSKPKSA